MEIWKDIKGYEGYYQVSNTGSVKSLTREVNRSDNKKGFYKSRILKLNQDKKGYLRVKLTKNSKAKTFKVHRIVADHFLKKSIHNKEINHLDGNKKNNKISNLEVCNSSENAIHAILNGFRPRVKLTLNDVIEIRKSNLDHKTLAKNYNVTLSNIKCVINRKSWKNV